MILSFVVYIIFGIFYATIISLHDVEIKNEYKEMRWYESIAFFVFAVLVWPASFYVRYVAELMKK